MASPQTHSFPQETQFARELQNRIFPSARPSIPNLDYYSDWRPASSASGDYLDYFEIDEGNLCLAIGEVTGAGVHAGLLTASLHSIVRALRFAPSAGLCEFVTAVDELFREVSPDGCHATLFVARYDPVHRRLYYINAGHEPPVVLRRAGRHCRTIRLETGGPVIGMLRTPLFHEHALSLQPGDVLAAYTDGLCEVANPAGEEWGWRRFIEAVQEAGWLSVRDMVERVLDDARDFAAEETPRDDMTLWIGRVDDAASRLASQAAECATAAAA
jgi:sigma-B regulation protein RsbU (phosphoserine phosphatase)